ncbi:P-loop containing nucleoside triphosphate hydrolase protein [Mycena galopus ATCC 62051]|nr:P-loop containing nucleoside triphosphate hydrolase protein [Mycena galopus ATCC 62051]
MVETSQFLGHCPPPSRNFQGRRIVLDKMHQFFDQRTNKQHIYVLYGLGGAGKTQIALKFIEESTHFGDQLVVDASTTETIETSLKNFATTKKIGNHSQDTLRWLGGKPEPWLLFFDNADDPKINLNKVIPKCNHGNIIITSRNPDLRGYGDHSQISDMEESDAVALLLKTADYRCSLVNEQFAVEIVKELYYLPLAIVQAGAFILKSEALSGYLALYRTNCLKLLSEEPAQSYDGYALSVFTTWQMSFNKLSQPAAMFLQLCSFIHREGITEDIFRRASCSKALDRWEDRPRKRQKLNPPAVQSSQPQSSAVDSKERAQEFLSKFLKPTGVWDSFQFIQATNEIKAYSLINFNKEQKSFSIHPLVHEWSRTALADPDSGHSCMGEILGMSISEIPREDKQLASLSLVLHVAALLTFGMPKMVSDYGLQYSDILAMVPTSSVANGTQKTKRYFSV